MAAMAAGIGEGDELITTPITFAASANCALYCGATPIFADINEKTYNIDPASVEEHITSATKAVVAVDYTGQAVELDRLQEICRNHNLVLIEDGAFSACQEVQQITIEDSEEALTLGCIPNDNPNYEPYGLFSTCRLSKPLYI
jgi:dTDP-4-amino-4,6-dideoxygalactose transaminase